MGQKKEAQYYRIRKSMFWGLIGMLILLTGAAYCKDTLYEKWLESGGWEEISFTEMESKLKDRMECYLCGSSGRSLMEYYRKVGTLGVISLNDWHILDLRLKRYVEGENENKGEDNSSILSGNTGEISSLSQGASAGGMASMDITLPEKYGCVP